MIGRFELAYLRSIVGRDHFLDAPPGMLAHNSALDPGAALVIECGPIHPLESVRFVSKANLPLMRYRIRRFRVLSAASLFSASLLFVTPTLEALRGGPPPAEFSVSILMVVLALVGFTLAARFRLRIAQDLPHAPLSAKAETAKQRVNVIVIALSMALGFLTAAFDIIDQLQKDLGEGNDQTAQKQTFDVAKDMSEGLMDKDVLPPYTSVWFFVSFLLRIVIGYVVAALASLGLQSVFEADFYYDLLASGLWWLFFTPFALAIAFGAFLFFSPLPGEAGRKAP